MMLLWMTYAMLVGALTVLGAFAVDRAARLARIPTRWVWAAAIALAVGLALRPPEVEGWPGVPTTGFPGNAAVYALAPANGDWLAIARWRLAESTRWFDVARVLRPAIVSKVLDDAYVIEAWIALSGMLAIAFVVVHARLRRARSRWPRAELHGAAVRLSASLGPAAIGLLRPEIVVPGWLLGRSDAEQRMAIAHELAHTRARDPQLLGAAWVALILFPWNPAMWVMVSRLRLALEIDCDRRVLRQGASPKAYGSLLVSIAELAAPLRPSALALADDSSHLKTRILAMDARLPRFGRIRAGLATMIGAIAVFAACEAKEPTAADVDAMTGASAEKAAQQIGLLRTADSDAVYMVDGYPVSRQAALRLYSGEIVSVQIRRGSNDKPEVDITTQHAGLRRVPPPPGDTDIMQGLARRNQADTSLAWFLNGVRVSYAIFRRLDGNSIESIDVIKGPAAEQKYGTPPGHGVIAVWTKGAAPK